MVGILFTLIAAFSYGANSVAVRRAMLRGSASTGVALTVLLGVPMFLAAAIFSGQLFAWNQLDKFQYLALIGAGLTHFVIGRYCFFRSVAIIGINRNSPLTQTTILYTVVIAVVFLGEQVSQIMGLGIILVLMGPTIMASSTKQSNNPVISSGDNLTSKRLVQGYLFGVVNGAAWGISPVLARYALSDSGLGILGGLVSYASAALVLLPLVMLPGTLRTLASTDRSAKRWFGVATITIFLAQLFRYMALSMASAILVTTLLRAAEFLKVIFSYTVNRDLESFDWRVILGIIISILGGILVVLG